ncbi:unnamed protein product [Ixodes pacificus]
MQCRRRRNVPKYPGRNHVASQQLRLRQLQQTRRSPPFQRCCGDL